MSERVLSSRSQDAAAPCSPRSEVINAHKAGFLPAILSRQPYDESPCVAESYSLRAKLNGTTGQLRYSYQRVVVGNDQSPILVSRPVSNVTRDRTPLAEETVVELRGLPTAPEVLRCEGPCHQLRRISDLRIRGRCEHAICTLCLAKAVSSAASAGAGRPVCNSANCGAVLKTQRQQYR